MEDKAEQDLLENEDKADNDRDREGGKDEK